MTQSGTCSDQNPGPLWRFLLFTNLPDQPLQPLPFGAVVLSGHTEDPDLGTSFSWELRALK